MAEKKNDKPKVFISYAWGSKEYQDKVLAFATQLMRDGIDVVIDKWSLSEGSDTFAFMEKCVTDESITNVLMLLDPVYAQKADNHSGGVGTETQIISPKVYEEVTQDIFIPIVFERDEDGKVCKPIYLQGRLHFDLSSEDNYDEEYMRLVRTLYGEETYKKPELGTKPAWVEKINTIEVKKLNAFANIKTVQPNKARLSLFSNYVSEVLSNVIRITSNQDGIDDYDDVLAFYKKFDESKEEYLTLLDYSIYVNDAEKIIAKELEIAASKISEIRSASSGLAKVFLHELFLYTIAFFLKSEDYVIAGRLLARPYYNRDSYPDKISGFNLFYSGGQDSLDRAMNKRDEKNYTCGTATYWIESIDKRYTKEQFVFADLICFNHSIYSNNSLLSWPWFPLTYIYDNEYASGIGVFTRRFISREYVEEILPLFGYETVETFIERMKQVKEEIKQRMYQDIRFSGVWHSPALLSEFVDEEKIASIR